MADGWATELAQRRKGDEDTHNHKLKMDQDMDRLKNELKKEQKSLSKSKASEAELGDMLSKTQSDYKAKARLSEELTRTIKHQTKEMGELEFEWNNSKSVIVKSV